MLRSLLPDLDQDLDQGQDQDLDQGLDQGLTELLDCLVESSCSCSAGFRSGEHEVQFCTNMRSDSLWGFHPGTVGSDMEVCVTPKGSASPDHQCPPTKASC